MLAELHPFVALMRRYCHAYTNSHDLDVCDEIMEPDYVLQMGPFTLRGRDDEYKPATRIQFENFPGLGLTVHEIVTNGDRLAMRFSEHGASAPNGGRGAVWAGIGLYRWNGHRLTENWVEQDYLSRRRQLARGAPARLEPPALDPWTVEPVAADEMVEASVLVWLAQGGVFGPNVVADDEWCEPAERPRIDVDQFLVDDLFSAGERAAFHVTLTGTYLGGLTGADHAVGREVSYCVAGLVTVADGEVTGGRLVTDRVGLLKRELA